MLAISALAVNGGAIAATDQDGVHVVGYLGDTTGNGGYSSLDVSLLSRVAANLDTGFAAFPLLDPTILADIAGRNSVTALDASYLSQFVANAPQPRIPALPNVAITHGGPDPLVWLPQNLSGSPGSAMTVPVMFRQTNATTIGLNSADLAIEFDPSLFIVTGVRLGNVPRGFTVTESFDNATGAIIASLRSALGSIPLTPGTEGTLLLIDLTIRPGADLGAARLNLLGEGRVGSTVLSTSLNEGNLTLVPAPTDLDLDPTDGVVTIAIAAPTTAQTRTATVTTDPTPSVAAIGTASRNLAPASSAFAPTVVPKAKPAAGSSAAVDRAIEASHGNHGMGNRSAVLDFLADANEDDTSVTAWIPWTPTDQPGISLVANDSPGITTKWGNLLPNAKFSARDGKPRS